MIWIDTTDKLKAFLTPLQDGGLVALDTEFLRTDTYYPRLCLVQLAREDGQVALIDPATCPLSPLTKTLSNPAVTVIIHAAFQDLELLYQATGTLPARIFDTQLAALLHGLGDQVGLASLLAHFLKVELDKSATRTDWCQRPLDDAQLAYAAEDVRHLIPLYHALNDPLTETARRALDEDFSDMLDPARYESAPEHAWQRLHGGRHLSAKQHTLLRQLAAWRERTAQRLDRPRRWIVSDDTLLALAKRPPRDIHKLKNVPGITTPQVREFGEAIIETLDAAFEQAQWSKQSPARLRPTSDEEPFLLLAKGLIQHQAQRYRFNPGAFDNHTLLRWLRHLEGPLSRGWRHLLIGAPLGRLQQGSPLVCHGFDMEVPQDAILRH